MRETHCTVGERLRAFSQSCWRRIRAAIQIFERLQTTMYIKFDLLENWSQITYLRTIEYATNTYKKYFYTFRINQVIFTYGERKKERPNFYRMFSQNLPISAAFTAILKMKLPQCKAIGVRTPPGWLPSLWISSWYSRTLAFEITATLLCSKTCYYKFTTMFHHARVGHDSLIR